MNIYNESIPFEGNNLQEKISILKESIDPSITVINNNINISTMMPEFTTKNSELLSKIQKTIGLFTFYSLYRALVLVINKDVSAKTASEWEIFLTSCLFNKDFESIKLFEKENNFGVVNTDGFNSLVKYDEEYNNNIVVCLFQPMDNSISSKVVQAPLFDISTVIDNKLKLTDIYK